MIAEATMTESKWDKIKNFFSRVGRRNWIIIGAVVLLGAAVCVNWVLFAGTSKTGYDYSGQTGTQTDAPATETASYFASTQVSRDRAREEALATLQTVVDSAETDSAAKTQALADIATMAKNIEAESNIQAAVLAKGIEQCVAIVNEGTCTVVLKTEGLLPSQMSQINEIVYEYTGIKPTGVKYVEKK